MESTTSNDSKKDTDLLGGDEDKARPEDGDDVGRDATSFTNSHGASSSSSPPPLQHATTNRSGDSLSMCVEVPVVEKGNEQETIKNEEEAGTTFSRQGVDSSETRTEQAVECDNHRTQKESQRMQDESHTPQQLPESVSFSAKSTLRGQERYESRIRRKANSLSTASARRSANSYSSSASNSDTNPTGHNVSASTDDSPREATSQQHLVEEEDGTRNEIANTLSVNRATRSGQERYEEKMRHKQNSKTMENSSINATHTAVAPDQQAEKKRAASGSQQQSTVHVSPSLSETRLGITDIEAAHRDKFNILHASSLEESEGDRLADAMLNGNATISSVQRGCTIPEQTGHRTGMSFSEIPMELRGSFIDGGTGPLRSEIVPGAFRAPGRAFGELPEWTSAPQVPSNSANDYSSRRYGSAQDSRAIPSLSQHTPDLRATTGMNSTTSMFEVATATLVEPESHQERNVETNQSANMTTPSEPLTVEVVPACEVVSEDVIEGNNLKLVAILVCSLVGFLTIVLVVLILLLVEKNENANVSPQPTSLMLYPRETTLPSREDICESFYQPLLDRSVPQIHTSPIVECYCSGKISGLPDVVSRRYSEFLHVLVENDVLVAPPIQTNCTDPRNLALLWLSESETPASKSIIRKYVLAVLFHALNGLDWNINLFWLSSADVCDYHGVFCDDGVLISSISLPDNSLNGFIPSELQHLPALSFINFSYNDIVGEIPADLFGIEIRVVGTSVNMKLNQTDGTF
mmetsp:Transcript_3244/g.5892  ORF Transcript_3244/g.5892 Transcript_3244/m.5892 type:complete len:750 (+) Transcript_3244:246-2495(+)